MADELVDIVNEKDEIVSQGWKSFCRQEGLFHRVAAVLLFDSQGKVWLQKRAKTKNTGAGLLDYSASGHVPQGESYEISAVRELEEELGIKTELKLANKNVVESIDDSGSKIRHIIQVYTGTYEGKFKIQEEELDSVALYNLENIKKMISKNPKEFTEGFKMGFKSYMGRR